VTYTNGSNTYTEDVTMSVTNDTADDTTHIANVNLGTQVGAATAVTILDTAINQISSSQAKLGAIQNRLQYNIDNLSKASMLTQTAKGRIMDADFASETSELSKQQILSQAATSMLAQANQSKQSVLALLQ
jgi:flagellin